MDPSTATTLKPRVGSKLAPTISVAPIRLMRPAQEKEMDSRDSRGRSESMSSDGSDNMDETLRIQAERPAVRVRSFSAIQVHIPSRKASPSSKSASPNAVTIPSAEPLTKKAPPPKFDLGFINTDPFADVDSPVDDSPRDDSPHNGNDSSSSRHGRGTEDADDEPPQSPILAWRRRSTLMLPGAIDTSGKNMRPHTASDVGASPTTPALDFSNVRAAFFERHRQEEKTNPFEENKAEAWQNMDKRKSQHLMLEVKAGFRKSFIGKGNKFTRAATSSSVDLSSSAKKGHRKSQTFPSPLAPTTQSMDETRRSVSGKSGNFWTKFRDSVKSSKSKHERSPLPNGAGSHTEIHG